MRKRSKPEITKNNDDAKNKGDRKSLAPLFKFFAKFILIIALYYGFVLLTNDSVFQVYLSVTAQISSFLLNILGQNTATSGNVIFSDSTSLLLLFGCEGTDPIIIFIAGMFAAPIPFKKKAPAMAMGVAFLYALNFLRIVILYFLQKSYGEYFELFHVVILPVIYILLTLICLGLCLKLAAKK